MKKKLLLLVIILGTLSFSNCNSQIKNIMREVMRKKYWSRDTPYSYSELYKLNSNNYYTVIFNKESVPMAYLAVNLSTGTVYNVNEDYKDTDDHKNYKPKIRMFQNKKYICKENK